MDEYSGKRTIGGFFVPKKSSSLVLKDTADNRDGDAQFCTRLGCNGRLNYTRVAQIGSSKKPKSWRPSFRSSSGKEAIGSSSRTCSVVSNAKKSFQESRRKLSSKLETNSSKNSSAQDELEYQELTALPRTVPRGFRLELKEAETRKVTSVDVGSSTVAANARHRNSFRQKSGLTNQNALLSSSSSSSSESTGQGERVSANASRHGLGNFRCNSISDVVPAGRTFSEPNISKRRDIVMKRSPEGESSSSVGGKKTTSGPAYDNKRISIPTNGLTFADSRRHRNLPPPNRESGVVSVRTRRSINGNIRTADSDQVNLNNLLPVETSIVMPLVPQSEISFFANIPSSLDQEAFSSRSSSYSHPTIIDNVDCMMAIISAEHDIACLMNRDGSRRYNIDSIAEVLLALERIEQDEELTYEQLLALETNLFIGGISFYDQHRDMRLDIDNMSYEELLALEEKMGTVSTALSEDALLKSVGSNTYQCIPTEERVCSAEGEDMKCSICQEEYVFGDEVGRVGCEHGYHMECIKQWLRLKNWCPICKALVAPSEIS